MIYNKYKMDIVEDICEYVLNNKVPLVFEGGPGCGKSTYLQKSADMLLREHTLFTCIIRCIKPLHTYSTLSSEHPVLKPSQFIKRIKKDITSTPLSKYRIDTCKCVMVDDASMLSSKQIDAIVSYTDQHDMCLIMFADQCTIQHPCGYGYTIYKSVLHSVTSPIFKELTIMYLPYKTYNYSSTSYMARLAMLFRNGTMFEPYTLSAYGQTIAQSKMYTHCISRCLKYDASARILCCKEDTLNMHIRNMRQALGYTEPICKNEELLVCSEHVANITNDDIFTVHSATRIHNTTIDEYSNLTGWNIECSNSNVFFIIDVFEPCNAKFLKDLVRFSCLNVKKYNDLRCHCVLIDDVYCTYDGYILDKETFYMNFPEVYDGSLYTCLHKDIMHTYATTPLLMVNAYCHTVYLDEHDFNCPSETWNSEYQYFESKQVIYNRLKYLACTRAMHSLYIIM